MSEHGRHPEADEFVEWLRGLDDAELVSYRETLEAVNGDSSTSDPFAAAALPMIDAVHAGRGARNLLTAVCERLFSELDAAVMADALVAIDRMRRQLDLERDVVATVDGAIEVAEARKHGEAE